MNLDPASDPMSDPMPELALLGAAIRGASADHPGDLSELLHRAEVRQGRQRVVTASVLIAAIAGIASLGLVRAVGDEGAVQVGGTDEPRAASSVVTLPADLGDPGWTVNPSIPMEGDDVWALDVTYDPATWDFSRLGDVLVKRMPYVSSWAGYKREPRLQAYGQGEEARTALLAARDELRAMPGIVSADVARAEPTSRPPATVVPGVPGVPGTGP